MGEGYCKQDYCNNMPQEGTEFCKKHDLMQQIERLITEVTEHVLKVDVADSHPQLYGAAGDLQYARKQLKILTQ